MKIDQLPLFLRKTFAKHNPTQVIEPVAPTGESPDSIFDRNGLAPYSRPEADEMYSRLSKRGI
jgi:hypothetical protein